MPSIYDRKVQIRRPNTTAVIGAVAYSGVTDEAETVIVSNLIASVQAPTGTTRAGELPAAPGPVQWIVYIKRGQVGANVIKDRDIVADDFGRRFQVVAADHHMLGQTLYCIILEAR